MEDKLDRYYTNVLSNAEKDKHTTVDSDDKSSGEENLDELLNELDRELDEDHEFFECLSVGEATTNIRSFKTGQEEC